MSRKGTRADFIISVPDDVVLTARGSFGEDGYSVGMVSYHPQLAPWIRLPACSLKELRNTLEEAARALGGSLSVQITPLAPSHGKETPRLRPLS
jgi:hypothetical protein